MTMKCVSRRDFSKLTTAAFGGMIAAGSGLALRQEKPTVNVDASLLMTSDTNVCRGLNSCKGRGKGKDHACAGLSTCATVAEHTCNGTNNCKAQGGCGGYPGQNTCKGKGHCAVPLKEKTWDVARKQLDHLLKDNGKKLGEAPKKG